jgi:glycosyltransferase involved in cell wall biosynthesis
MAKVLIIGYAPLPIENQRGNHAINNRTWLLTEALAEEGHEITLLALRIKSAYFDEASLDPVSCRKIAPNITYYSIRGESFKKRLLERQCRAFGPDCVVGAGTIPSYHAVQIDTDKPIWADLFGHLMAEAQTKAYAEDNNLILPSWWMIERSILKRADVFSAVSFSQKCAVIGELGALGRLNKFTLRYDFLHTMPICVDETPFQHAKNVIRGSRVKHDDFVVLWSGGYNTWTDVDTLFAGLCSAMKENPRIKFVSTGGALAGYDDATYERFVAAAGQSAYADRFIFLGWVPTEEVQNYYLESDVGVNIDKFSYEAVLGARNRIVDMIKAALPVITTRITEISRLVQEQGLGLTFPVNDPDELGRAVLKAAENPALLERFRGNQERYCKQSLSCREATRPLKDWARNPKPAPDFGEQVVIDRVKTLAEELFHALKKKGAFTAACQGMNYCMDKIRRWS